MELRNFGFFSEMEEDFNNSPGRTAGRILQFGKPSWISEEIQRLCS